MTKPKYRITIRPEGNEGSFEEYCQEIWGVDFYEWYVELDWLAHKGITAIGIPVPLPHL